MANRWGKGENSDRFSLAPKSPWTVTAVMKLKHLLLLGRKTIDEPRHNVKRQGCHFVDKGLLVKAMFFQ